MATVAQPPLRRKVTSTVVTENLPVDGEARPSEFYAGDPWEVIARIHREFEKKIPWEEHIARVYRTDAEGKNSSAPENNKFTEPFDIDSLRERFGGGHFKVWVYGPPERSKVVMVPFVVSLEGAAKNGVGYTPRNGTTANGTESSVAIEAMRLYANPEFVKMQMQLMVQAATEAMALMRSQMPQPQNALETLKTAKEILGGGQNNDNSLVAHITLLKELGLIGSPEKKGISEVLETLNAFKTAGLIPSAAPKADLASTFAANLPMLADRLVNGLHEFRLKAEAEERAVRLSRGEMRPDDPNVITVPPSHENSHATADQPAKAPAVGATAVSPEVAQAIIAQAHLHRLVEGIKQPNSTGQDMYDYLVNAWPEVLFELEKMSKETLLAFFKNRDLQKTYFGSDILAEVGDDPRLPKMIEDFLRIAKEEMQPEPAAASAAV